MAKKVKLLIQCADRLGDMVFVLPVIEHIKKRYPRVSIHVLSSKIGTELLANHPLVDQVITVHWEASSWLKEYRRLIKRLKKENYVIYMSLWNNPWMAFLGQLAQIPIRIGDQSHTLLQYLYNKPVVQAWNDMTRHQIQFNLDLLSPLFIKPKELIKKVYVDDDMIRQAKEQCQKYLNPDRKKILIMTSTGQRNDPFEDMTVISFIEKVMKTNKFDIILCGYKQKRSPLNTYKKGNVLNLISKTSLAELLGYIHISDFYIGGDTGPTHLASLMDKTMIFYSPRKGRSPTTWGPQSSYFKIIRNDYLNSLQARVPDGEFLYHTFCELVQDVSLNLTFTPRSRHHYLMCHSIRVLYVYRSRIEFETSIPVIKALRKKGMIIFTQPVNLGFLMGFKQILRLVRDHNINVIQGRKIPFWFTYILRFIMGTIFQYRMPVALNQTIHDYIDKEDYLDLYEKSFRESVI